MGLRRKSRELALQALYQADMCGLDVADIRLISDNFRVAQKAVPYATTILAGIRANQDEIDTIITGNAKNWRVDRMSIVDRNLIRIGIFELVFQKEVPASVVINEAIEIAKRFSTDESSSFINGILDAIRDGKK
nr:transcription antitermination factor NusB [Desulfobulbaceae bacterium]